MKKRICVILISIVSVLCLAFGLSACSKVEFKVSFVVDEQTVYTINTNGNEVIAMPPDPQKKDYIFDGWYWDKDVWEKPFTANSLLDAPLSSNMNVYCKWRPEHEHAYTEEVIEDKYKATDASCTHKATYYYVCECGEKGTETFEYGELLQHTPKAAAQENFVDSTCTQEGSYNEVIRCKDCDTVISTTSHTIEKKQHSPKEAVHENEVDSTCSTEGHYDEVVRCSVCDTVISSTPKTTEKKQHTPKTAARENVEDSTCTKEGNYDEVIRCEVCDEIISSTPKTIEKKQHTPKAAARENVVDSTCTQEGSYDEVVRCEVCNTVISSTLKTIEKKPHTWGDWTEKDSESHKRTCGVCKTEETENHELGGKNGDVCTKCAYTDAPATIKSLTGATINQVEKTVKLTVDKNTTRLLLSNMVTVSSHSGWKIYDDSITEVVKTIPLADGYNIFYITVTDTQDDSIENTYTFTVYKSFEVTLNYYGVYDDIIHTETIVTGYEFTVNYTPEITGYTFNHWKLQGEQTTKFTPFDDVNLYANCTAKMYNVLFVTDSKAQAVESFTATYDKEVTLPASSKTGYTFNGWIDGNEISQTTFVWKFTEDKEYTAKFTANQYTVTYVPDGGTVESTSQTVTYDDEFALYEVEKTGYTFTGWYNGDERVADGVWQRPDDITLTAHWQANTYTVTFDADGGTCETTSDKYVYDSDITLPEISRVGYTFTGWYNGGEEVTNGTWKIAADCTLTAQWQANTDTLYTVKHMGQNITDDEFGVEFLTEELHGTSDSKVTPAVKSYTGFTSPQTEEITVAPDGSATLTYYYTRNGYTLTLCANDGRENATQTVKYEAQISSTSERQGYTFGGWFTDVALTESAAVMPSNNLTVYAWWQEENRANDFNYTTGQDVATITGYKGTSATVTIPAYIGGVAVTELASNAFQNNTSLTGVTISDTVTTIGERTFYGCEMLMDIAIPNSVTSVGNYAFYNCIRASGITIGSSVETIGDYSFSGCDRITSITIPSKVKSIGNNAFAVCNNLKTVYWNATACTKAGSESSALFINCIGLSEVVIGDGVTAIPSYAFYDCNALKTVTMPDSLKNIGDYAFAYCSVLTNMAIPDSVNTIGRYAFGNCDKLEDIVIPDSVLIIRANAFYGCNSLISATIGSGATLIGECVFDSCSNLTTVYWNATECTQAGSRNYPIFNKCGKLSEIIIGSGVKAIPEYAFSYCSSLTNITVPNSVTSIGGGAFHGCSGLASITLPFVCGSIKTSSDTYQYPFGYIFGTDSYTGGRRTSQTYYGSSTSSTTSTTYYIPLSLRTVTITGGNILYGAFYNCSGLTSITIPDDVTTIGNYAFYGCTSLMSITIPHSVNSIAVNAFSDCVRLCEVYNKSDLTIIAGESDNGYVAYYAKKVYTQESESKLSTDSDGFIMYDEHTLVNYIGNQTSITIPNSVVEIGDYALDRCNGLTSITVSDCVTSIGKYAFRDCNSLEDVTIGNNVTSIGSNAFYGCKNLTRINYIGDMSSWFKISGLGNLMSYGASGRKLFIDGQEITGKLIIPDGLTSIGNSAFSKCSSITGITIPDSVTSIGNSAFRGCNRLTSLTIPDSVTSIGNGAFSGCSSLMGITIPDNVTEFGSSVFSDCNELRRVTIGNGVTSIGSSTFSGCSSLTSITIPKNVTSIGSDAFYGCSSLETVYWNAENCTSSSGFYNCTKLTQIIIGDNVKIIPPSAFSGCSSLTSITIPDSVTAIGGGAFNGCSQLMKITIPNNVTSVGNSAFRNCTKLSGITIGNSVTSIGNSAFDGCKNLSSIHYTGDIASWLKISGLYALMNCHSNSKYLYIGEEEIRGELIIPVGVTAIGSSAFLNCKSLTSITIPNGVTSIGGYAFNGCSGLTSVTIGNSVTSIGRFAFNGCSQLENITIPDTVTTIGSSAFYNCSSLTDITIPNGVTSIGEYAFYNCSGLTSVTIPDGVTSIGNWAFSGCSGLTSITIPNGVTSIGSYAFSGCSGLKKATIGNNVTTIGDDAFYNCSSLTSITIPDSVTSLCESAFRNCAALRQVTIGNGVTCIKAYTFRGCTSLTSITISDSVTRIENFAFEVCNKLTSVYYCGTAEDWDKIWISSYGNNALNSAIHYYNPKTEPTSKATIGTAITTA